MVVKFYGLVIALLLGMGFSTAPALAASVYNAEKPEYAKTRYPIVSISLANIASQDRATVSNLALQLLKVAHSDEERAFAVFRWITTHISYDVEKLRQGVSRNLTAAEVLDERKAVCGGYAALFHALAKEMGLRSFVVHGKAKGYGLGAFSHAWNAVEIEGKWFLLDSTWGSGYLDDQQRFVRQYNDDYFLVPAEELIFTHYPDAPNWQLLDKPIALKTFLDSEQILPLFFKLGLTVQAIDVPTHGAIHKIAFKNPYKAKFAARLMLNEREVQGNHFLVNYSEDHAELEVKFPKPGGYVLEVFGQDAKATGRYNTILKKRVNVVKGDNTGYPLLMEAFQTSSSQLIGPKRAVLGKIKAYDFKIIVPNAIKVAVIDGKQWHWLKPESTNVYSGQFRVRSRKVILAAAFASQKNRFEYLVTYDVR